jgi:hypothetical protein
MATGWPACRRNFGVIGTSDRAPYAASAGLSDLGTQQITNTRRPCDWDHLIFIFSLFVPLRNQVSRPSREKDYKLSDRDAMYVAVKRSAQRYSGMTTVSVSCACSLATIHRDRNWRRK